ncbi:hypothetical protein ACFWBV_35485 [Streptomyces sp. NPDC060030]|uniref:hypothetical protein n=1 Tax=Streptomyces sp. NPDC060030 TaxID=3347042 RepID=UPI0036A78DB5
MNASQKRDIAFDTLLHISVNFALKAENGSIGRKHISLGEDQVRALYARAITLFGPRLSKHTKGLSRQLVDFHLGRGLPGLLGGGSGIEGEFTELMEVDGLDEDDIHGLTGEVLVRGKGWSLVVEDKTFFVGPRGRLYRREEDVQNALGEDDEVEERSVVIPEFVTDILRVYGNYEKGRWEPGEVLTALNTVERRLQRMAGREGLPALVPLTTLFPEGRDYQLTDLGRRTKVGSRPINDWQGAHFHYTFGVPISGLSNFLGHVRDHTWRNVNTRYMTRDHLSNGLAFGERISGAAATEFGNPWSTEMTGYLALLYSNVAAYIQSLHYTDDLRKVHAGALSRNNMQDILRELPSSVQQYLYGKRREIASEAIADIDSKLSEFYEMEISTGSLEPEEARNVNEYLRAGLGGNASAPQTAYFGGMNTLQGLDRDHKGPLPFVVVEVRSYGARHVSADHARAYHSRLIQEARRAHDIAENRVSEPGPKLYENAYQHALQAGEQILRTAPSGASAVDVHSAVASGIEDAVQSHLRGAGGSQAVGLYAELVTKALVTEFLRGTPSASAGTGEGSSRRILSFSNAPQGAREASHGANSSGPSTSRSRGPAGPWAPAQSGPLGGADSAEKIYWQQKFPESLAYLRALPSRERDDVLNRARAIFNLHHMRISGRSEQETLRREEIYSGIVDLIATSLHRSSNSPVQASQVSEFSKFLASIFGTQRSAGHRPNVY